MAGFLLDTNVLGEIRKGPGKAQKEVWEWWLAMEGQELFLSVMTLGEVRKGIDRLRTRDVPQVLVLERWLDKVRREFNGRLIPVTVEIADRWGKFQATRSLPEVDALLAATVLEHDLILVTRNETDFDGLGIRVLNPFPAYPNAL